jgi:hypothetical protein
VKQTIVRPAMKKAAGKPTVKPQARSVTNSDVPTQPRSAKIVRAQTGRGK